MTKTLRSNGASLVSIAGELWPTHGMVTHLQGAMGGRDGNYHGCNYRFDFLHRIGLHSSLFVASALLRQWGSHGSGFINLSLSSGGDEGMLPVQYLSVASDKPSDGLNPGGNGQTKSRRIIRSVGNRATQRQEMCTGPIYVIYRDCGRTEVCCILEKKTSILGLASQKGIGLCRGR